MSEAAGGSRAPPLSPRQARMGPAPFASFEELSDEVRAKLDSPDEKPVTRLPHIREDVSTPGSAGAQEGLVVPNTAMDNVGSSTSPQVLSLQTPSTPRIDISRASSSSHHDSRDSSPENAIFGISEGGRNKEGAKLGLGFREDGTADLRSSTEELAFLEPNTVSSEKESSKQPTRRSPLMFKEDHHRKDSQCSDIVLLSISGRTSRLSSIGSQGSGHSNASGHSNMSHISGHSNVSHISGQSRLSVISGVSRSPSPHKMLLETSFCGPKPLENEVGVVGNDKHHSEVLEQVLLSRKHDPREAILAEGIMVHKPKDSPKIVPKEVKREPPKVPAVPACRLIEKPVPIPAFVPKTNVAKKPPAEPIPKEPIPKEPIPKEPIPKEPILKELIPKEPILKEPISKEPPSPMISVSTLGSSYKAEVRPESAPPVKKEPPPPAVKSKPVRSAGSKQAISKPAKSSGGSETDFVRIKLKPDHMYDEDAGAGPSSDQSQAEVMQKPITLNLNDHTKKSAQHFTQLVKREDSLNKISRYPSDTNESLKSAASSKVYAQSPNLSPKESPSAGKRVGLKDRDHGSRTPSPAGVTTSRKSSFCSLFKSRETIASPESPLGSASKRKESSSMTKDTSGSIHSSRSRSKSKDRDKSGTATPTSGGKAKGSVLAIFKPHRKASASASPVARESLPNLDGIHTMEYKYSSEAKSVQNLRSSAKERLKYYDAPVDGFIRIPLHTPSDDDEKTITVEKTTNRNNLHEDMYQIKIDRPVSAPSSSRPSISQPSGSASDRPGSSRQDATGKQFVLPDGSIRIPLHSPSEDRLVRCDLMTDKEIEELNQKCSKISTKKGGKFDITPSDIALHLVDSSKNEEKPIEKSKITVVEVIKPRSVDTVKMNGRPKELVKCEDRMMELPKLVEKRLAQEEKEQQQPLQFAVAPEPEFDEDEPPVEEEKRSSQSKKHIIFTTKVGSKDQLFSLQFSLSKTDSQCSQMSDNRSQISEDSVIEVPISEKRADTDDGMSLQRSPSIDSKSNYSTKKTDNEVAQIITDEVSIHSTEITESKKSIVSAVSSDRSLKESPITTCRNSAVSESMSPRNSVLSTDDVGHDSSESERDSELDFVRKKQLQALEKAGHHEPEAVDHERKGLVLQQDSFDDELPYIPTTLPQERSVAVPIVPVKQRQGYEMKTFPIERPRSTTPINPSCLEEYCSDEVYTPDASKADRLKISLPKEETPDKPKIKQKAKSPRRISSASSPKTWFEFAEQGISNTGPRKSSMGHESDSDPAPPLPPRAPVPKPQWINFEDIPERRKLPKRIQTIPSRTNIEVAQDTNVVYTYVNPEDCKCECHESSKETTGEDATPEKEEDEEPLLDDSIENDGISAPVVSRLRDGSREERKSVVSDSSLELSYGADGVPPPSGRPFTSDLDMGSNRSSIISQDADRSSSSGSPNVGGRPPRPP